MFASEFCSPHFLVFPRNNCSQSMLLKPFHQSPGNLEALGPLTYRLEFRGKECGRREDQRLEMRGKGLSRDIWRRQLKAIICKADRPKVANYLCSHNWGVGQSQRPVSYSEQAGLIEGAERKRRRSNDIRKVIYIV